MGDKLLSDSTIYAYKEGFRSCYKYLSVKKTSILKEKKTDIEEWLLSLQNRKLSVSTINLRMVAARSFYEYLTNKKQAKTNIHIINPMDGIKSLKREADTKRAQFTDDDIERAFDACSDNEPRSVRDRAMLFLMAFRGLRTIEVERVNIKDVHHYPSFITLEVQSKGSREIDNLVRLGTHNARALNDWIEIRGSKSGKLFTSLSRSNFGDDLSLRAIGDTIRRRLKIAGVYRPGKSVHKLRYHAINSALRAGASLTAVKDMAGHKTYDGTMSYVDQPRELH